MTTALVVLGFVAGFVIGGLVTAIEIKRSRG